MSWITTNIRFPEEDYMKLKLLAAQKRVSLASILRDTVKKVVLRETVGDKEKILTELNRIADIIGKRTGKKWDSVKALREVRYHGS